jgi:hypothetical protein
MAVVALTTLGADKKIVFIAGSPSHGPGEHEHRAGCLLLKSCLDNLPGVTTVLCSNGWPGAPNALAGAATIVVYSDGAGGHPLLQPNRLKTIGALMDQGVGLVCLHFAVEPTLETGEKEFLNWIGGAFEINWSVNPTWTADFKSLPDHPITRGVKPFKLRDEWYFHMRFREGMKDVTPILSAVPDQSTTNRNDGPRTGGPGRTAIGGVGGGARGWRTGLWFDWGPLSPQLGRRQFAQARVERDLVDGENRSPPGRCGLDDLARPAH